MLAYLFRILYSPNDRMSGARKQHSVHFKTVVYNNFECTEKVFYLPEYTFI